MVLHYFCPVQMANMLSYFLQVSAPVQNPDNAYWYFAVGLQLLFAIVLVAGIMVATHMLGPSRQTADKLETFTSGIKTHGDARQPMAIKYFLVAILFVLFDVEGYSFIIIVVSAGWGRIWLLMFVGFSWLFIYREKVL
jgi:NADH-quinone oxidoreductase subunit A